MQSAIFSKWSSVGLAALTGFLFYISFPGVDMWPVAFVAWIPWMVALRGAKPGQAALQGLVAGIVMGVFGFYWLMNMLETFSGFPAYICALFMVILCAYQAGRYALLGWLYARAEARGWPGGFVFTAAFATTETIYPLLFPFTFGATMHEVYPIVQVAELGGPILVSLVVLAPNWALATVIVRFLDARREGRKLSILGAFHEIGWRHWAPLLCVPLVATAYGMVRIVQVDEAVHQAEKIRVGIVQANMSLEGKRTEVEEGLKRHIRLTKKLVRQEHIELVVWPETSVVRVVHEDDAGEYYRRNVTGKLDVPSIVGAVLARKVDDARGHALFNSALMAEHDGKVVGRYDKHFLLAFGEYLPLGEQFPVLYDWSPNSGQFSPGTSMKPLEFDGHSIATFICYEDIVPSFVNALMKDGTPELLVNMTNDAWFGDSTEPWEHMALAKLRAVEHRRYLVRATNTGISGFVDPVGRLVQQTPTFKEAAIAEDVAWLTLKSPYRLWGNAPWMIMTVLSLLMSFFRRPAFLIRQAV